MKVNCLLFVQRINNICEVFTMVDRKQEPDPGSVNYSPVDTYTLRASPQSVTKPSFQHRPGHVSITIKLYIFPRPVSSLREETMVLTVLFHILIKLWLWARCLKCYSSYNHFNGWENLGHKQLFFTWISGIAYFCIHSLL